MTGFARAADDGPPGVEVSVRSVNNRFLDLKIRTPAGWDDLEARLRTLAAGRLKRGSVQIAVEMRQRRAAALGLNRELAAVYLDAYRELAAAEGVSAPPDLSAILRLPGVLEERRGEDGEGDRERTLAAVEAVAALALDALAAEREREGAGIAADLRARARSIADETEALFAAASEMTALFQRRLAVRLGELLGGAALEPQRLAQEAAVLADRCDVSEELQRLASHTAHLLELLDAGGEAGKAIDFLAQEMNRETNTLLSKTTPLGAAGLPLTQAGLRLKAEIEKVREQAQNLE